MFKKDELHKGEVETVIGPSVKIEGEFTGQGNIIIEGVIQGNVRTDQDIEVRSKAKVFANIKARNAKITGEIHGNLTIKEFLELGATAIVNGDVQAKLIKIDQGAIFNGKCTMKESPNNASNVISQEEKIINTK